MVLCARRRRSSSSSRWASSAGVRITRSGSSATSVRSRPPLDHCCASGLAQLLDVHSCIRAQATSSSTWTRTRRSRPSSFPARSTRWAARSWNARPPRTSSRCTARARACGQRSAARPPPPSRRSEVPSRRSSRVCRPSGRTPRASSVNRCVPSLTRNPFPTR